MIDLDVFKTSYLEEHSPDVRGCTIRFKAELLPVFDGAHNELALLRVKPVDDLLVREDNLNIFQETILGLNYYNLID